MLRNSPGIFALGFFSFVALLLPFGTAVYFQLRWIIMDFSGGKSGANRASQERRIPISIQNKC